MTDEPRPKVVALRFDDVVVQVRELSVDTISRIARRNMTDWVTVIDRPASDLAIARDVIEAAAMFLGVDIPKLDSAGDVMRAAEDLFELVDDDIPEMPVLMLQNAEPNPTDASATAG